MKGCQYSFPGSWSTRLLIGLFIVLQLSCSSTARNTELAAWSGLSYFVDGIIEIQLKIPPAKFEEELNKMQFIGIKDESLVRLFMASYDPGRGKNRDLLMTRIWGTVIRVKKENDSETSLSLEDIKNRVYLSRPGAAQDFEFAGEFVLAGRSWLRIDLVGSSLRNGVSYASAIHDNYVLILSMSIYGEDSDKTRLYRDRHEDLKEVLKSVRISSPGDWSVAVPLEPNECTSIDGDYQILGLGKLSEGASMTQTRLDSALGYTFPSGGVPKHVSISMEEGNTILNFNYGDPVNRSFSESADCDEGWYAFGQQQTDQYVGDGADLDYSLRKIRLGKAVDGSLIVHLMLEAQFSSFVVLKSHEVREIWSRYEQTTNH